MYLPSNYFELFQAYTYISIWDQYINQELFSCMDGNAFIGQGPILWRNLRQSKINKKQLLVLKYPNFQLKFPTLQIITKSKITLRLHAVLVQVSS